MKVLKERKIGDHLYLRLVYDRSSDLYYAGTFTNARTSNPLSKGYYLSLDPYQNEADATRKFESINQPKEGK
jgi:hypothetical protein